MDFSLEKEEKTTTSLQNRNIHTFHNNIEWPIHGSLFGLVRAVEIACLWKILRDNVSLAFWEQKVGYIQRRN